MPSNDSLASYMQGVTVGASIIVSEFKQWVAALAFVLFLAALVIAASYLGMPFPGRYQVLATDRPVVATKYMVFIRVDTWTGRTQYSHGLSAWAEFPK